MVLTRIQQAPAAGGTRDKEVYQHAHRRIRFAVAQVSPAPAHEWPAAARVILPVLLAGVIHSLVIGWDLLPGLRKPLDLGARFRGEPLLGVNKTIRGPLVMAAASA